MTTCAWCDAPRVAGGTCPRCGADYARAEQIKSHGRAAIQAVAPITPAPVVLKERVVEDPSLELKFCIAAVPAALALGVLFHFLTPGLQRIVFGMPLHELGHAVSAWFCGFWAIPTFWRTIIPEERGWIAPLLLAGALGYGIFRAHAAQKTYLVVLCALLLVLQGVGTLGIRERTAVMFYTFGGDGLGMVLAAALMASFFFGKRTQLYKGALRWGFLVIGAGAFADMFSTWVSGDIPFGEIEGVGLSDPLRLVQEHGWSERQMVRRYIAVGVASLAGLALVYAWGVRHAWRKANP